ncbi:tyrosine-type recombinase/integrase [Saccharopolyspora sp. NPDC003752]
MGEISVKQVGKSWAARAWFRREDGTYADVRRRGRTKELARQAVRDAVKDLAPATAAGADVTAMSLFDEVAQLWLAQFRDDAENGTFSFSSLDTYSDAYRNHVKPALGRLRVFEVKTPVVSRLCQAKLKAHSVSLAKHVKAVISHIMIFAMEAGAAEKNPVKGIAPLTERRAKTKRKKARSLTRDDVFDLLGKLDTDEEAQRRDLPDLVRFFIATGERSGEALGARWTDFDAKKKKLRMDGNIIQARGKGTVRNDGKSETAGRDIPLTDWCVQMLLERKARLGVVNEDMPVFTNTKNGYLNASNVINRVWVPFRTRAGYEWVTFHTLRKTFATLQDEAGLTARQVADLLGHSHVSMTQDNYFGRGQESRAGAEALDFLDPEAPRE